MPSLQDLKEFKASLKEIGREPFVLSESGEVYEDIPLPDSEPIPLENAEFSPTSGAEEASPELASDDYDFSNFLDSVTDEAFSSETDRETDLTDTDFSVPDDLLRGFSDDIEASRSEAIDADAFDLETPEPEESGMESLETEAPDTGLTETPVETESEPDILDLENLGGEELGFEESPAKIPEPELPASPEIPDEIDFSIPEFEGPLADAAPASPEPSASTEDLGDLSAFGGTSFSEFEEFSLEGEPFESGAGEPPRETRDDTFDNFLGTEDFSLAGIDDLFKPGNESSKTTESGTRTARVAEPVEPQIEEIQLSEEDYKRLENTLLSYPLNLRIACEELISEQAVLPDQMEALIKLLVKGAKAHETAALASRLLGRSIPIPKGFEKKTGEELEAEQATFSYIFRHRVLPILGLFFFALLVSASLFYLSFAFIYTPLKAESLYKKGYELISAGDYQRANERFSEAFSLWKNKSWFFKYAEQFRDKRQYNYAEKKYEELLRYYPQDKKGALEFADFEVTYLQNYSKADRIVRTQILDYSVDDREGLIALGDVNLAWGDLEPDRYEEARKAFARYMEKYGREDPVLERMLKYFIRTDNLAEVLPLQAYFMESGNRKISGATLAEMGGYLLDKKLQDVKGVPDIHIGKIEGLREVFERAIKTAPGIPEGYYHLARYNSKFGKPADEQAMLEKALSVFDEAPELSGRRIGYHIDTYRRYAQLLIKNKEFISAQAQLIAGISLYEDALKRRVLTRSPDFGRLYADLADIEYFSAGNYENALRHYQSALNNGWAPAEMQYRMGTIYYTQNAWQEALDKFFACSLDFPLNRRLLFALGNTAYRRGDFHAAQGYYNRLLDILETERSRFPMLAPNDRPEQMELVERLMMGRNNLAATLENLADVTGNNNLKSQALALYAESSRAWDLLTRDPKSMVRSGSKNLAYLNTRNSLYPISSYERQIYTGIDKDVLEPSLWEELLGK